MSQLEDLEDLEDLAEMGPPPQDASPDTPAYALAFARSAGFGLYSLQDAYPIDGTSPMIDTIDGQPIRLGDVISVDIVKDTSYTCHVAHGVQTQLVLGAGTSTKPLLKHYGDYNPYLIPLDAGTFPMTASCNGQRIDFSLQIDAAFSGSATVNAWFRTDIHARKLDFTPGITKLPAPIERWAPRRFSWTGMISDGDLSIPVWSAGPGVSYTQQGLETPSVMISEQALRLQKPSGGAARSLAYGAESDWNVSMVLSADCTNKTCELFANEKQDAFLVLDYSSDIELRSYRRVAGGIDTGKGADTLVTYHAADDAPITIASNAPFVFSMRCQNVAMMTNEGSEPPAYRLVYSINNVDLVPEGGADEPCHHALHHLFSFEPTFSSSHYFDLDQPYEGEAFRGKVYEILALYYPEEVWGTTSYASFFRIERTKLFTHFSAHYDIP